MTNRHQFMEWLQEIDPDVQFDGVDQRTLFISPSNDSPLLDTEAMFDIESPEMFQFLASYVREFSCMWQYKKTQLWREGDVWGFSHVFPNKTALQLSLADAPTDLDLFNFIIMMNDSVLPFEAVDDSPDHTQAMIALAEKASEMRGTHKAWDNLASVFDMGEDWFTAREITNRVQFVATIVVGLILGYDSWSDFTNWDEIPNNLKFVKEVNLQYVDWERVVEGLFNVDEEWSQYMEIEREQYGSSESTSDENAKGE